MQSCGTQLPAGSRARLAASTVLREKFGQLIDCQARQRHTKAADKAGHQLSIMAAAAENAAIAAIRAENEATVAAIRGSDTLHGLVYHEDTGHPYPPPMTGTTATPAVDPSSDSGSGSLALGAAVRIFGLVKAAQHNGKKAVISRAASSGRVGVKLDDGSATLSVRPTNLELLEAPTPVYYDWGANWPQVAALLRTPEINKVLHFCVDAATRHDDYWFNRWDKKHWEADQDEYPEKEFPFWFLCHRRIGNGEQDQLLTHLMPTEQVRIFNGQVADYYADRAEVVLAETGEAMSLDIEMDAHGNVSGQEFQARMRDQYKAWLKDNLNDQTLMCSVGNSYQFMPLHYKLAQSLMPDAQLVMYSSSGGTYSVVYDTVHHIIVFDSCAACDKNHYKIQTKFK